MKILFWKNIDWSARNFIFQAGHEIIGQLTFYSTWNFNATYSDNQTNLRFSEKGFFSSVVFIKQNENIIGQIESQLFGKQILRLSSGEQYELSTSFWGGDVYWKNEKGETIIKYEQASFSSMGKGTITLTDTLVDGVEKLLLSSGLFVRQLLLRKLVIIVAVMIPVLVAARR